ncbi:MAG: DUF3299 domain-containing protein [Herminiimonas sp.]|nr:DUF3299 domain-containing protein [Herminiimonas sp.]
MRSLITAFLLVPLLACAAAPVPAGPGHTAPPGAPPTPAIMQPLPEIKGVVSWNTLAKVKQIKTKDRILPEFSKDITSLNDKEVKLQGFMMPLEPGEKQQHFLISVNSQSCSYCLPAGPEGVVEVKSKTPIKYTFEPIMLSGKMTVLKDDPMGLYYRLSDASPASTTAGK